MKIKMGNMRQMMDANLEAAQLAAPRWSPLRSKLRVGKSIILGAGSPLQAADAAAGKIVGGLLSPGGIAARAGNEAATQGYSSLVNSPIVGSRALKLTAAGALLASAQNEAADKLLPLANESIQEGRTVYANDKEFLAKKLAEAQKTQKTAGGPLDFAAGILGAQLPKGSPLSSGYVGGAGINNAFGAVKDMAAPLLGTTGYRMNRAINPLSTRVRADELFAENFVGTMGSEIARTLTGLLRDVAGKAVSTAQNLPAHRSMLQVMQDGDPILASADPEHLTNAYHTMAKFAPTLATDENAVRSFLRQAASSGTGVDFVTIKAIADTEKAITNHGGPK